MDKRLLYVVYHDEAKHAGKVAALCAKYGFCRPLKIAGDTPYFEGEAFALLRERQDLRAEWQQQADFVGIVTHSFADKCPNLNIDAVTAKGFFESQADVVALYPIVHVHGGRKMTMVQAAVVYQGDHFAAAWTSLLCRAPPGKAATAAAVLDECRDILPFYCNYWMAKRDAFEAYLEFAAECRAVCDGGDAEVADAVGRAAYHVGGEVVGGASRYKMHPFVFERLPCYFFRAKGFKVAYAPPAVLNL